MQTKIKRIQELTKQLNQYRNEYYNLNNPSISDETYDTLFDELQLLEKETNYVLLNSPTQTVGYEIKSKLSKRMHPTPLKSLDKTKSIDELNRWKKDKEILLMLKADGLTVELNYENGKLVGAYTRGNGEIGEDVTHNARTFKNIPLSIPFKGVLRISGEAIIHWNDFNVINSKLSKEEQYATPRNLVAGSVRQLDSKMCAERYVYFYAFNILEVVNDSGVDVFNDLKHKNFECLGELGFWTIGHTKLSNNITEDDINIMKEIAKEIDIPIDGLVASFNSIKYSESLGETSHHPLHSLAYKFTDEIERSILRSIEWQVGRTGVITPVANFDTVILDGTEVNKASVHNLSIIEGLELGIGDRISVYKANQIIPQIKDNFDRSNNVAIPELCPICEEKTMIEQLNESKVLKCTNDNCSAKLLQKFVHFCSRDAMNIEGLSEATLEKFINKGWLKTFADIYKLENYKTEIARTGGFGVKSYNRIWSSIEKSKIVKMENFLVALGISNIGRSASKTIAKYFNNDFQAFIRACRDRFDFSQLEDFGCITNQSIHDWYRDINETHMWIYLCDEIEIIQEGKKKNSNMKDLSGLVFVITGSVNTFKNRDEFKSLVESLNGKVVGSVTGKTDYLVNNDIASNSSKNKKAKELCVKIITEEEFNKLIGR